ncbi:hypothetical protein TNCV_1512801 [Trichonephila clavipes]|nr:hypothetical protein TNCV_1512801 [Trichonephila clavipes]
MISKDSFRRKRKKQKKDMKGKTEKKAMGPIVLPVWLGSTRTRIPPPGVSPLLDSTLPIQILVSSSTETVQRSDEITYFHQENNLEEEVILTSPVN